MNRIARRALFLLLNIFFLVNPRQEGALFAQSNQCVYPIIFAHGFTGSQDSWIDFFGESRIAAIYGSTQYFHGVINANTQTNIWGADGLEGTDDDDVLLEFNNLTNDLSPGCLYAYNWENFWNENESNPQILIQDGSSPSFITSDSNESSSYKQGYALGVMIDKVLQANPDKEYVLVVGHSMGGLIAREYLQRTSGQWWARSGADGHRIKKLVTLATPHRGSNLLGNPFPTPSGEKEESSDSNLQRDGIPDINSEAVRDLRYSFATSSCFPFSSRHSPYLYGGDEACIAFGFWNDDVNADGDENDIIIGLNEQGAGNIEDGSVDNPVMPLPQNLRYTYITSTVDLIVSAERQLLFDATGPRPRDPASPSISHLLSDTLDVDAWHLSQTDEIEDIARAIDEGDYPKYAWRIKSGTGYMGLPNFRSTQAPAPENRATNDPDWFVLDLSANPHPDLECNIVFQAGGGGLNARVDFYMTPPSDFSSSNSSLFAETNSTTSLLASGVVPGQYYIRVYHESINKASWENPYSLTSTCIPLLLPVELSSFDARVQDGRVHVNWSTESEINSLGFKIQSRAVGDPNNWLDHGFIKSNGGENISSSYAIVLDDVPAGRRLIRLKQIDFDATTWTSHSIELEIPQEQFVIVRDAYPNPFRSTTTIEFSVSKDQNYRAELFDIRGQLVDLIESGFAMVGSLTRLQLNDHGLASGAYILKLSGENFVEEKLITKIE